MDWELVLIILVDGLVYASYLFMVAVGLTVILGVQKVLNVTHGSFYAFGAYLAAYTMIYYYKTDGPVFVGFAIILISGARSLS